ncbi:MAG: V-type ATP synthase subunit F [Spirochaetes bacterium]|nr:V-type ATP synthase subunit F [Spirochaetota bacterium]
MEKIVVIGDIHTVTAFRLGGVEGVVSSPGAVKEDIAAAINRPDAAIVLVTRELADHAGDAIGDCNLNMVKPVIVEIPGINDQRGFGRSIMSYITEALGISI